MFTLACILLILASSVLFLSTFMRKPTSVDIRDDKKIKKLERDLLRYKRKEIRRKFRYLNRFETDKSIYDDLEFARVRAIEHQLYIIGREFHMQQYRETIMIFKELSQLPLP